MKAVCGGALALLVLISSPPPPSAEHRRLQLHYTVRDQQQARYAYVPVDVPPGTTRLTVSYEYDRADNANAVDLGIYEPGPLSLGTKKSPHPAATSMSGGSAVRATTSTFAWRPETPRSCRSWMRSEAVARLSASTIRSRIVLPARGRTTCQPRLTRWRSQTAPRRRAHRRW